MVKDEDDSKDRKEDSGKFVSLQPFCCPFNGGNGRLARAAAAQNRQPLKEPGRTIALQFSFTVYQFPITSPATQL
jgi:hypothetical protein